MFKRIIAAALLCNSLLAGAASLDIGLANTSAKFSYLTESGSLGYAGADVGYDFYYNETGDKFLGATVMVIGNAVGANRAFQYGFGAKADYGLLSTNTFITAISIGGTLRYLLPAQNPIGISIAAYGSPAITSFGDTENVYTVNGRLDLEVMPNTRGYLGYRLMEVQNKQLNTTNNKYVVDDSVVFGVRLSF